MDPRDSPLRSPIVALNPKPLPPFPTKNHSGLKGVCQLQRGSGSDGPNIAWHLLGLGLIGFRFIGFRVDRV